MTLQQKCAVEAIEKRLFHKRGRLEWLGNNNAIRDAAHSTP